LTCSEEQCTDCNPNGDCNACKKGYAVGSNKKCVACKKGCDDCSSPDVCRTCSEGWFDLSGKGTCQECDSKCKKCGPKGCEDCSGGYFANKATGMCEACGTNCDKCTSPTQCNVCVKGFFENEGKCIDCDPSCSGCSGSPFFCTACHKFYQSPNGDGVCTFRISLIFWFLAIAGGIAYYKLVYLEKKKKEIEDLDETRLINDNEK